MIYPWHQAVWDKLTARPNQLPHALLLHGAAGIGKLAFAKTLCHRLLCLKPTNAGFACGQCQSCHWLEEGTHPDLKVITQELQESKKNNKQKQHILIHQIRALADFVNLTSHQESGKRIMLIHPAHALNQAASNALLKMLEEPSGDAMFILVTDQLQRLLPTVLSRCVKVHLPTPSQQSATQWLATQDIANAESMLAYHSNAPLAVMAANDNQEALLGIWQLLAQGNRLMPAELASKFTQISAEAAITIFQKWLYDLGLLKQTGQVRYHPSMLSHLTRLVENMQLNKLLDLQQQLESLRKLASHPLNHELQFEVVLLEYTKLFNPKR